MTRKWTKGKVFSDTSSNQDLGYAFHQALGEGKLERLKLLESQIRLFHNELLSEADVELVTNDGLSIKAHHNILAVRSPIFRVIFEVDGMKEPHKRVIHIQELNHDQLKYPLEFLYFELISKDKLAQHSHFLLIFADKYDIPALVKVCESYILTTVCPSNALKILELATLCSAKSLKSMAMNVILEKYDEIVFSKEYEDFTKKSVILAVEVTRAWLANAT